MAFIITAVIKYGWVPDGAGGGAMGQNQADFPGFGATATPGTVFISQSLSDQVGEGVPGGDSPSGANFQTALNQLATDAYTRLTTAGAVPGFTSGTALAQIQGFSTGGQ